jgi:hypothetical protein
MKLFKFEHREDFGHEWYFKFLFTKNWALLQMSFDWCEFPGFPYVQATTGMGKLFGILLSVWRFGFCAEVLARTWRMCYDEVKFELEDLETSESN